MILFCQKVDRLHERASVIRDYFENCPPAVNNVMQYKTRDGLSGFSPKHFPFGPVCKRAPSLYDVFVSSGRSKMHRIHVYFCKQRGRTRYRRWDEDVLCFPQLTQMTCPDKPGDVICHTGPPVSLRK